MKYDVSCSISELHQIKYCDFTTVYLNGTIGCSDCYILFKILIKEQSKSFAIKASNINLSIQSIQSSNSAALLVALKYILIGQRITMHIVAGYINIHTSIVKLHYSTLV